MFKFDSCMVDRVNLREHVVWSHPRSEFPALTEEEKEDENNYDRVQMLAEDYIKMGMAWVEKVTLPEPYLLDTVSRKILVIGGGITGISAAIDAAGVEKLGQQQAGRPAADDGDFFIRFRGQIRQGCLDTGLTELGDIHRSHGRGLAGA